MLLSALTITILAAAKNDAAAFAFVPSRVVSNKETALYGTKVGIFFGTSTGSTQEAADLIAEEFGDDVASSPIEIDEIQGSVAAEFAKYDALVVGTPTWNTGADVERSGTGWDEIYYGEMADLNIAGKKVAVFGLGDSVSYSENYADASGELYDVFESLGCSMLGATSTDGYLHEASKAIRGDKFCGLLLDEVNQEELTGERVKNWVAALISEGLLSGAGTAAPALSVQSPAPVPQIEAEVTVVEPVAVTQVEEQEEGFLGHYNSLTDKTWWVGNNGRSSFVTNGPPEMHSTLTKTNARMSP
mmetsp:Transcript_28878/g.42445  ORF Transcript_28878/g.42445 Transcript_28878/m.42445 type:complete len:302 (-) Transcript_28878:8-913(-)